MKKLADYIFTDAMLKKLLEEYQAYMTSVDVQTAENEKNIKREIGGLKKQTDNIIDVIAQTASPALLGRLQELEQEKTLLEKQLQEINYEKQKARPKQPDFL